MCVCDSFQDSQKGPPLWRSKSKKKTHPFATRALRTRFGRVFYSPFGTAASNFRSRALPLRVGPYDVELRRIKLGNGSEGVVRRFRVGGFCRINLGWSKIEPIEPQECEPIQFAGQGIGYKLFDLQFEVLLIFNGFAKTDRFWPTHHVGWGVSLFPLFLLADSIGTKDTFVPCP